MAWSTYTTGSSLRIVILADTWYARHIVGASCLNDRIPERLRSLTDRSGLVRGLALLMLGRRSKVVVTVAGAPGSGICIITYGLLGRRKLVLLNYMYWQPRRIKLPVFRLRQWLLGRALLRAHVATGEEARIFSKTLPIERLEIVHWPSRFDDSPLPSFNDARRVVATGRRTDWKTFFAAADGTDWEVRVVCRGADLAEVRRLAFPDTVIRHDISLEEHQAEVDAATLYVIPLPETGGSIGQIRVMNATQAGVPIVASDVIGLRGYLDGSCAGLVPAGDAAALRKAVNDLLDDPERREVLRIAARQRGGTMSEYLDRINALIKAALDERTILVTDNDGG